MTLSRNRLFEILLTKLRPYFNGIYEDPEKKKPTKCNADRLTIYDTQLMVKFEQNKSCEQYQQIPEAFKYDGPFRLFVYENGTYIIFGKENVKHVTIHNELSKYSLGQDVWYSVRGKLINLGRVTLCQDKALHLIFYDALAQQKYWVTNKVLDDLVLSFMSDGQQKNLSAQDWIQNLLDTKSIVSTRHEEYGEYEKKHSDFEASSHHDDKRCDKIEYLQYHPGYGMVKPGGTALNFLKRTTNERIEAHLKQYQDQVHIPDLHIYFVKRGELKVRRICFFWDKGKWCMRQPSASDPQKTYSIVPVTQTSLERQTEERQTLYRLMQLLPTALAGIETEVLFNRMKFYGYIPGEEQTFFSRLIADNCVRNNFNIYVYNVADIIESESEFHQLAYGDTRLSTHNITPYTEGHLRRMEMNKDQIESIKIRVLLAYISAYYTLFYKYAERYAIDYADQIYLLPSAIVVVSDQESDYTSWNNYDELKELFQRKIDTPLKRETSERVFRYVEQDLAIRYDTLDYCMAYYADHEAELAQDPGAWVPWLALCVAAMDIFSRYGKNETCHSVLQGLTFDRNKVEELDHKLKSKAEEFKESQSCRDCKCVLM